MAFFLYNGYSVPDRTGTSTGLPTPSCVFFAPPPRPWYVNTPARLWLHACIRRHFWWQSSAVVFIPSELVMSAPTRVSV